MKVGDLKVVLKLTVSKFKAGLMKAKAQLKTFKGTLSNVAVGMKNAFLNLIPIIKRFGLVVGVAFAAAGVASARFEEQIQRTAVILGQGTRVGAAQFKELTDRARQLGRDTLFSSTQAAKGMKILAKAGFSTKEVIGTIGNVVDLAVAQETDLETATHVLAATMRQFGLETKDSARVADVLTVAANKAMITVAGLGDSLKYSGAVSKAFGNELEDTVAVTAAMANLGLEASQTGTALRRMLTRLVNPSKESANAMKFLGLEIEDKLTGKMKPTIQILADLQRAFTDTSKKPIELQKALAQLAGQRGITAVLGLVSQTNLDLQGLSDSLKDTEGAANSMAQQFRETTIGRVKDLMASLNELAITIIGAFGNSIKDAIFGIRNFTLEIEKSLREGGNLKIVIDGIKEGLQPLKALFKRTGEAMIKWLKEADPYLAAETFKRFFLDISESVVNLADALAQIDWKTLVQGLTMVAHGASMLLNALTGIVNILSKGIFKDLGTITKAVSKISAGPSAALNVATDVATNPKGAFNFVKDLFTKQKHAQEEIRVAAEKQGEALDSMKETVMEGQAETTENLEEVGSVVSKQIEESGQVLGNTLTNVGSKTTETLNGVEVEVSKSGQLTMQAINQLANAYGNLNSKMNTVVRRLEQISQKGSK